MNDHLLTEVDNMSELSQARLWKSLDSISDRLGSIETQLSEIVRLEERVKQHDNIISRFGSKLDTHDNRIRQSELWQANQGDKSVFYKSITSVKQELQEVSTKVHDLENDKNVSKGQKDVGKEILKWLVGILAVIIAYKIKEP